MILYAYREREDVEVCLFSQTSKTFVLFTSAKKEHLENKKHRSSVDSSRARLRTNHELSYLLKEPPPIFTIRAKEKKKGQPRKNTFGLTNICLKTRYLPGIFKPETYQIHEIFLGVHFLHILLFFCE